MDKKEEQLKHKNRLQIAKIIIFILFTIYIITMIFIRPTSLYQFGKMIETVTNESWGKFNGHGKHCGFGGKPEVAYIDMIDGCCKTHDRCWENVGKNLSHPNMVYFVPYSFEHIRENGSIICKNGRKSIADLCLCDKIATECFKENLKLSKIFENINGTKYYDTNQKSASLLIQIQNFFDYPAIYYLIIFFILLVIFGSPFLYGVYIYRKSEDKYKIINYVLNNFFPACIFFLEIRILILWYQQNFNCIIMVIFVIKLFILFLNNLLYIFLLLKITCKKGYTEPPEQNNTDNTDNNNNPDWIKVLVLVMSIIHTFVTFILLIILYAMLHS